MQASRRLRTPRVTVPFCGRTKCHTNGSRPPHRPSLCGSLHHPRSALLLLATTIIAVGYFILEPPMHLFHFLSISTSVRLPHSRHLRLASTSTSFSPPLHPLVHCPSSIALIDIDAMNCRV